MARANPERQKEMAKKLEQGKFSIRDWREQLSNIMGMGSLSKIASMIPGMPQGMLGEGGEEEASAKLKRMIFITDAMRQDELDSDGMIFVSPRTLNSREILPDVAAVQLRQAREPGQPKSPSQTSGERKRDQCPRSRGATSASKNDGWHGTASWRAEWMVSLHSLA